MSVSVLSLIIFTGAVCVSATTPSHEFHYMYGCYESDDVWATAVFDDDVLGYADFTKDEAVWTLPHPTQTLKHFGKEGYEIAKADRTHCHDHLRRAKTADPNTLMRQEPPDNIYMYTRYEEEDGMLNTLYCLVSHFYPPSLNVTWLKNDVEVTEGAMDLRYRHNRDGTLHRISTLSFTPRTGDVYTCKVKHPAAQQPSTRSWELKKRGSVNPAAVFLSVSVVLSLMGITAGVFFIFKEPN